jgi:hypothetical protein
MYVIYICSYLNIRCSCLISVRTLFEPAFFLLHQLLIKITFNILPFIVFVTSYLRRAVSIFL